MDKTHEGNTIHTFMYAFGEAIFLLPGAHTNAMYAGTPTNRHSSRQSKAMRFE